MGYCAWAGMNELNKAYHDNEWGIPVHDDRKMFEHLILECMQCGLSWDLMLKKRDVFRMCFDDFNFDRIADYDESDIERIMNTEDIQMKTIIRFRISIKVFIKLLIIILLKFYHKGIFVSMTKSTK